MNKEEQVTTDTERCSCGAEVAAEAAACDACGSVTTGFAKAFDTMVEKLRTARGERTQVRKQAVVREAVAELATYLEKVEADNTPWDGGAAMAAAGKADDPAAAFRAICAGEHTVGEPDERQHWALPHHKKAGGPPNTAGVGQALGRVNQTEDLKNPASARKHLQDHSDTIHGRK